MPKMAWIEDSAMRLTGTGHTGTELAIIPKVKTNF